MYVNSLFCLLSSISFVSFFANFAFHSGILLTAVGAVWYSTTIYKLKPKSQEQQQKQELELQQKRVEEKFIEVQTNVDVQRKKLESEFSKNMFTNMSKVELSKFESDSSPSRGKSLESFASP